MLGRVRWCARALLVNGEPRVRALRAESGCGAECGRALRRCRKELFPERANVSAGGATRVAELAKKRARERMRVRF
jgi:bacterioferritin-associated ferredoxin